MAELFRDPKIDWIGAKKIFIPISILLLLIGAVSVQVRGFNLGIDFTGGTLMTVRFKDAVTEDQIRSALSQQSEIDTSKVTIQKVLGRSSEFQIRAPQSGNEFQDKRTLTRALQKLSPEGDISGGKVNINTINAEGVEMELNQANALGLKAEEVFAGAHPYRQVGEQVVAFRDFQNKGFLQDIGALQSLNLTVSNYPAFDQNAVKSALLERFYAGKIDLNLVGTKEVEDALYRIDPLGDRGSDVYKKAAEAIGRYRNDRDGVISSLSDIQLQDVPADLLAKMDPYFTTGSFAVVSADVVGPQVGDDLRKRAIYVTLAALAGMLIYVAFRFEWIYGVAAVGAVFHDVMVTLGIFSLIQEEISLTVIAALLTLVGFSMNDTIVIFDRIRENLRLRRRDSLVNLTNDSINQTLSRTVITNGLTFLSVFSILLFGGDVLRGFSLALTIGIIIGTYSTIGVASPIMLWWQYLTRGRTADQKARAAERNFVKA